MTWKWRGKKIREPEPKPKVRIEPDPNMAPGEWEWSCVDCDVGGTGPDQKIRAESMNHCLAFGHSVKGNFVS